MALKKLGGVTKERFDGNLLISVVALCYTVAFYYVLKCAIEFNELTCRAKQIRREAHLIQNVTERDNEKSKNWESSQTRCEKGHSGLYVSGEENN